MKKDYLFQLMVIFLLLTTVFFIPGWHEEKQPVNVEYFKQGQILFPDYSCNDTLVVIDAAGLNKAFAYVEQDISWGSDADCDSLIHQYCKPLNEVK